MAAPRNAMESFDLVVIGAGWSGLAAAKHYKDNHPSHEIAILDYASSIGGVWAKHRHYPGLKSNNLLGMIEYPGFPMDTATFGIHRGQYPTAQVIHEYHKAFAKKNGILGLVRCSTRVVSAEHKVDGGWDLVVCPVEDSDPKNVHRKESTISTRRLVVATGLVSEPFMPHIKGQEVFGRPLFHSKDFLKYAGNPIDTENTKRVTVFGGSKSAWDAVYAYGTAGVKVDWVIRASGHGPCWMAPSYVTPFKRWIEQLVNTRFLTWLCPCIWSDAGGYSPIRSFLHGTVIGRALVRAFWTVLGNDVMQLCGFDKHPEIAKLRPWKSAMLTGSSFSILNYDTDFFELIRDGSVTVHIADLDHLSPGKAHLADEGGTVLETDAMMCVTGWNHIPPLKFLPEGIERDTGLPYFANEGPGGNGLASRHDLFNKADAEIISRFPILANPSVSNRSYVPLLKQGAFASGKVDPSKTLSPMLLYHFIVPPSPKFLRTKDLAFAGATMNFSSSTCSYLQGLWITAYFDGTLARDPSDAVCDLDETSCRESPADWKPTLETIQYETVLHNRFGKWRYPADHGAKFPDFVFEAVPYMDVLMKDLGLEVRRKGGWWREVSEAYGPEDYADIDDEWRRKFGKRL